MDRLIEVREPYLICPDNKDKFSNKLNGVFFEIRAIFSNCMKLSFSS